MTTNLPPPIQALLDKALAPTFDDICAMFTFWTEKASTWKYAYHGAAYSTRIKAAIVDLKSAIAECEKHPELRPDTLAHDIAALGAPSNLFVRQDFTSHSGQPLNWKIECDALTDADIETLAFMLAEKLPAFGKVTGIPRGGLRIAAALEKYATEGASLIVDDVLTTGASFTPYAPQHPQQNIIGAVIFARGPCPDWITPLFLTAQGAPAVERLVDAMWQLLDDMDETGLGVCYAAKEQAHKAFAPFVTDDTPVPLLRPFADHPQGHSPAPAVEPSDVEADRPKAIADIAAERERQKTIEGWSDERDDKMHWDGDLAKAAGCYALHAGGRNDFKVAENSPARPVAFVPRGWPWSFQWWKPSDPRRELVKAGALIVAEIERLDRAALVRLLSAPGDGA